MRRILVQRPPRRNRRIILGAVSALGSTHLTFSDGSSEAFAVNPDSFIFMWSGPTKPAPTRVQVSDHPCRVDGHGTSPLTQNDNSQCNGATP